MNNIIVIYKPIRQIKHALALLNLEQVNWLYSNLTKEGGSSRDECLKFICFENRKGRRVARFFYLDAYKMVFKSKDFKVIAEDTYSVKEGPDDVHYEINLSTSCSTVRREKFYDLKNNDLYDRVKHLTKERIKNGTL